jgi:ethanolamine ammonia-lyase small subunit
VSYPTKTWLELRADHAAARDAVSSTFDLSDEELIDFLERHQAVSVSTQVPSDEMYLGRPDLGRRLLVRDVERLRKLYDDAEAPIVQLVLAGGLSASAAITTGPGVVDALVNGATALGWTTGRLVVVERARVGVLNDLGECTGAKLVILVIGERPGLAHADSVSAYLGYEPRTGHTDANRNLISGINERSMSYEFAARRILGVAQQAMTARQSGWMIKENPIATLPSSKSVSLVEPE